ncbi:MAG: D-alanyl-D-alanine carboxypeptidase [Xanthomonadales bacterium]|nr:D-alanyl-D-alanine carboxypeptidase [Gammaproteobacteria bacterium]NNE06556.1 D-alanyl-D-alanine carboxypeptidase [Xanthomonadales bacterium]NNL96368.1 D-alanyl-D-alanine carboxypeptidase [Xanthomonadales bacterium]
MNMKIKATIWVLLMSVCSLAFAQVPKPGMPTPAPPQLGASSYVLMDFNSGEVLVEQNADDRVEPASITKLMTSYVVFQELASGEVMLDEVVNISENAWRTPGSRMFLEPSMQVTVEELLNGLIIQSGNDASVALAEHLAGTEDAFAQVMNYYAQQLRMENTNFTNSTGLPGDNHYSTARDTALLSIAIIRDFPDYYRWYSEKEYSFNNIRQHNRNNLLWRDPAVDGLKTGHTENAGYCLAASAKREGMRLISVVMGSFSEQSRASESQSLLNYGFRFFETVQLYQAGQELTRTQVWKGEAEEVALGIGEDLFITIPRGRYDDLDASLEMQPELKAPLDEGQQVGRISIQLGDEIVATRGLVTLEAVTPAGFFGRAMDGMRLWFGGLFGDDE